MRTPDYSLVCSDDSSAGFANVRDNLKHLTIAEIKEISKTDRLPFAVACLSVTGDLNVGTIIRSAHLMGASDVFVIGRRKLDRRPLVGIQNYQRIHRLEGRNPDMMSINPDRVYEVFVEHGLRPIVLEHGGIPLQEVNWKAALDSNLGTPCLTVGNEGRGFDEPVLEMLAKIPGFLQVTIPQRGVSRSHNVAMAANICMWDMVKGMEWF